MRHFRTINFHKMASQIPVVKIHVQSPCDISLPVFRQNLIYPVFHDALLRHLNGVGHSNADRSFGKFDYHCNRP